MVILRVAVPSPLRRYFDYLPPAHRPPPQWQPGARIKVPFGRRQQIGIITEIRTDTPIDPAHLRSALALIDPEQPALPAELLRLLRWAQQYYQHPPGEVYATALPTLLRQASPLQVQLEPIWRLSAAGQAALTQNLARRAPRQAALLQLLAEHPTGLSSERLRLALPGWSATARSLRAKDWIESRTELDPIAPEPVGQLPTNAPNTVPAATDEAAELTLNAAQQTAVEALQAKLDGFSVSLLEGVTGSGKTEVYLRAIEPVLARGRQALVLVPEIGLTPQLLDRFQSRLNARLAVFHSGLTDRERLNAWLLARDGVARVVLGTRSAVFTPLPELGLIIIDEEHDPSFKQQDGFRYNARDLAIVRAQQHGVPIVLGSATPSLESVYNARRGRYQHLSLPERVGAALPPKIEVLDVRHKFLNEGLSEALLARVERHLARSEQVLLFLNRRGFAPTLICHECGWSGNCNNCDAHLTLHLRRQRLICHHCGAEQPVPTPCPACGSVDLRPLGLGTERIEQVLTERFPDARLARIDRDSTRRKGSLQGLLEEIRQGQRQLLIGTQMLAKGHHFPNVTLVGIIDADQGLFSADFRASERLAQLILQVAGRAGRADRPGTVLIQTHHPDHPLLQTLINGGYDAFAQAALAEREQAALPPFTHHALLRAEAPDAEAPLQFLQDALAAAGAAADPDQSGVELLGPVPAPMERRAGRYRSQLLLQSGERAALRRFLEPWLTALEGLKSARKVRWSLDVDPLDLF